MVYRHQMRELLRETFCLIAKMSKTQIRPSSVVVNAEKFARTRAFVLTSSAVFLLVCLVWPFTVTDYQSIIDIPFVGAGSFGDRSELASRIGEMVRAETGGEQFESIVDQIEAAGKLHSKTIEFRDYVALRDALHVGVQDNDGRLRLRLSYEGQGGDDEQELVKILAARISERLSGSVSVAEMPVSDSGSPVVMSADQRQRFDEAKWLVSQIELDLDRVTKRLDAMSMQAEELPSSGDKTAARAGRSHFRLSSSSRVVSSPATDLRDTIAAIDVASLKRFLVELENAMSTSAGNLRRSAQPSQVESCQKVGACRCKIIPVNGSPGLAGIFLIAFFSIGVGTIVAWNIEPFENRGFDKVESVAKKLGVPIVATIKAKSGLGSGDSSVASTANWSNRITTWSSLVLFGVFVVVAGFVLINSEVRESFFENPFYGFANILRIFVGY